MDKKIKIVIADDHSLFSDGLAQVLQQADSNFHVVAQVRDGKKLIQILNKLIPDLILLDINMPYMDGIEVAKTIRKLLPKIKIVIISMIQELRVQRQLQQINVDGYIGKDINKLSLYEILKDVLEDKKIFPLKATQRNNTQIPSPLQKYNLTLRELEILELVGNGSSTKEIADQLSLSEYTVQTHRKNIIKKTGLHSTSEMICLAQKTKNF